MLLLLTQVEDGAARGFSGPVFQLVGHDLVALAGGHVAYSVRGDAYPRSIISVPLLLGAIHGESSHLIQSVRLFLVDFIRTEEVTI